MVASHLGLVHGSGGTARVSWLARVHGLQLDEWHQFGCVLGQLFRSGPPDARARGALLVHGSSEHWCACCSLESVTVLPHSLGSRRLDPCRRSRSLWTCVGVGSAVRNAHHRPVRPAFDIIQPVLQFPDGAERSWAVRSWYVTLDAGAIASTPVACSPGDNIFGNMTRVGPSSYFIGSTVVRTGEITKITANARRLMTQPWAYNTLECAPAPVGHAVAALGLTAVCLAQATAAADAAPTLPSPASLRSSRLPLQMHRSRPCGSPTRSHPTIANAPSRWTLSTRKPSPSTFATSVFRARAACGFAQPGCSRGIVADADVVVVSVIPYKVRRWSSRSWRASCATLSCRAGLLDGKP
jgi:hypothetical protein